MARIEVIGVQGVIPFVIQLGDLKVRTRLEIIYNLAGNVLLGTTYINQCIQGIFTMEHKIVPPQSVPDYLLGRGTDANVTTSLWHEACSEEHSEHATIRVAKLKTILAEMESPIVVVISKRGPMTNDRTQTAKQTQWIPPAQSIHDIRTYVHFEYWS